MSFLYLKSLHIIFVVTWFAGLFYIVRLFVYYAETEQLNEPEKQILQKQYKIMQRRLWYGITWPSAILTLILGTSLALHYAEIPSWLWTKIGFVAGLFVYHIFCHTIFQDQQKNLIRFNSYKLRIINEISTVFLFVIVFIVVLKNSLSWIYGLLGVVVLTLLLLGGIRFYKKTRNRRN